MRTLYLCGAGNSEGVRLALIINRQQARWDRIFLLDDDVRRRGQSLLGVEIVGPLATLKHADPRSAEVASLIARTANRRWLARCKIAEFGVPTATLIHPGVETLGAECEEDTVVYSNATLGPQTLIGAGSVVFMGAAVGHESRLGQCCVIAPNAVINARAELGEGVYVGANATVLPEIKVGPWATIGAGSVVMRNVPAGATVLGVPAKIVFALNRKPPLITSERVLQGPVQQVIGSPAG